MFQHLTDLAFKGRVGHGTDTMCLSFVITRKSRGGCANRMRESRSTVVILCHEIMHGELGSGQLCLMHLVYATTGKLSNEQTPLLNYIR